MSEKVFVASTDDRRDVIAPVSRRRPAPVDCIIFVYSVARLCICVAMHYQIQLYFSTRARNIIAISSRYRSRRARVGAD